MRISKLSLFQDKTKHPRWKGGVNKCLNCNSINKKSESKHCIVCYKKIRSSENSPNWKGGKTSATKLFRQSKVYKIWRQSVFQRDSYTCISCGNKNGKGKTVKLNAHHIKPFSLFPELRLAIDNGVTLCVSCHRKTDTFAGKIKNYHD